MRGRFFEHLADIWGDGDSITGGKPTDTSFSLQAAGVECYIQRRVRQDGVTLVGRTDENEATIYFPSGTVVKPNGLIIDRSEGPNYGQCWMVRGLPVDEPGSRRAGPRLLQCECIGAAAPPEVIA